MRNKRIIVAVALLLSGCREADGPLGGSNGQLIVDSDPQGARIFLDDHDTGLLTPDTIVGIGGVHEVFAVLTSGAVQYSYGANVIVQGSEPFALSGPLTARCSSLENSGACYARNRAGYSAGDMTVSLNALGAMFLEDGNGQGLMWPQNTSDTYASNAMPMIAAKVGGKAVALGMYDVPTLAGRPSLVVTNTNGELRSDQKSWIVPISSSQTLTTIRGIEIREQMLIDPAYPGIALIKLTYRNITNSPAYQRVDPRGSALGTEGLTYDDVYIGFGMDPDIGNPDDDVMTYDPALNAVFAYDSNFNDTRLNSGSANSPGILGLRMLSAPGGAPIILNGYSSQTSQASSSDWHATTVDEATGWGVMSGTAAFPPDDADATIGMVVTGESDVRMLVSAGPYALRPAEELSIVVAVAIASPVPGTYSPTTLFAPGNPRDTSRPILVTAAALRKKLTDAADLLPRFGN
jgi:hypothetical protein